MFKTYCIALVQSFYNPRIYRDAITRWQGFGGAYLALLAVILGALLVGIFLTTVNTFEKTELPHLLAQVPDMNIKKGEIVVKGDQPAIIRSSDKKLTVTIDTTKSESELRDTKTTVGIGKTFIFFQANGEYEVSYLDKLKDKNILVNKENLKDLWDQLMPGIRMLAPPLTWLGQFMDLMIKALIVAVFSYVVTAFMPEEYVFLTRMRLAALALTPASIVSMLMLIIMGHETAPWFVLLLAALYIYVMIMLIRRLPAQDVDIVV